MTLFYQAPYLPWVLLGFSLLLGNSVSVDLLGMAVGHIYYFLEVITQAPAAGFVENEGSFLQDVFPNQPGGWRLLQTPQVLKALCDPIPEDPAYNPPPEERPGGFDWGNNQEQQRQGDDAGEGGQPAEDHPHRD